MISIHFVKINAFFISLQFLKVKLAILIPIYLFGKKKIRKPS